MTSSASVSGDERLRLFLRSALPDDALDEIEAWQRRELAECPGGPREHLHVTLAFLGHRPAGELRPSSRALRDAAAGAAAIRAHTRAVPRDAKRRHARHGRRRRRGGSARRRRPGTAGAARRLRRESRPWLPHLTVARWRERPRLRPEPPPRRTFVPSDAAAYLSRLHPDGARYEVLESVALGG